MNRTGVEKILFPVKLIPFNKKIPFLFIQQKIQFDDQTGSMMKEIYHSLSFISLISFNLAYTDEKLVKLIQKTNKETYEIQQNSAKKQVLMRTNKILWYK